MKYETEQNIFYCPLCHAELTETAKDDRQWCPSCENIKKVYMGILAATPEHFDETVTITQSTNDETLFSCGCREHYLYIEQNMPPHIFLTFCKTHGAQAIDINKNIKVKVIFE